MKKILKKSVSLLLTLAVVTGSLLFLPYKGNTAEAASTWYIPGSCKNMVFYCAPDDLPATYVTLKVYRQGSSKKPRASSIKSLTSSDSSIARPWIDKAGDIRIYFFKKTGTADISFQIGKQTLTSRITVKEYTNPLTSFKVGKKDFTPRFNFATEYNYFHTSEMKKETVSLRAAKGWKISSLKMQYGSGAYEIRSCKKSSFSKKVAFNGDLDYITLTMYHTRTKSYVTLTWNCIRE